MSKSLNRLIVWITNRIGGVNSNVAVPRLPTWTVDHRDNCVVYSGMFAIYGNGKVLKEIPGRIVEWPGLPTDVYVFNPPVDVRRHPKGHCLQLASPNSSWFKLHWQKAARDFDASRAYLEQILNEAVTHRF